MLDEELIALNKKRKKVFAFGDKNFDRISSKLSSPIIDYIQIIESNAFSNLIIKPTRETPTSQTTINHILTNDGESILNPSVFNYASSAMSKSQL